MRVHIEAVVGDGVTADRMNRLGAHLTKTAFGDVEEIGSERGGVRAEPVRVLGRIAGDDKTLIDEIITTLEWTRLGRNFAVYRGSPLRLRFGFLRGDEDDGIRIVAGIRGE